MTLTSDVMNRLAVVRYLFDMGVRLRREPVPGCFPALLAFDDALELFMHGAVLHIGAKVSPKGNIVFDKYFELAAAESKPFIDYALAIQVHEERNMFKHRGHWPTRESLDDAEQRTRRFLDANCMPFFEIEFAAVSLSVLIKDSSVRELIEKARSELDAGRADVAMIYTSRAFSAAKGAALHAVGLQKLARGLSSELWQLESALGYSSVERSAADAIKKAFEHANERVADAIAEGRLGLDDARYFAFDEILPDVPWDWNGDAAQVYGQFASAPTQEIARDALQFAIETIIRMQERMQT